MGQAASQWTSYEDYRPNILVIAHHPHSPFPLAITTGLAQIPPSPAALQTLSDFIGGLFYVEISTQFYIALCIGNVILLFVALCGAGVSVHRFKQRKLWYLRFERRARGVYIVPNALNAFLLCEMSFCIAWICYVATMYMAFVNRWYWASLQLEAFGLFLWFALYMGVLSAAVGSFFSVPGALDSGNGIAPSGFHKLMRRPMVINGISIGVPLLLVGFLAPICVLAQVDRSTHWHHYRDFANRIRATIAADDVTATVADDYLIEASNLWSESSVNLWTKVGWAGWAIFYGILLAFYLITGGYMLVVVKRQMDAAKVLVDKQDDYHRNLVVKSQPRESLLFQALSSPLTSTAPMTMPLLKPESPVGEADTCASPSTQASSPSTLCSKLQDEKKLIVEGDIEAEAAIAITTVTRTSVSSRLEHQIRRLSSVARRPSPHRSRDSGLVLRWKYLRRSYHSLMIMYLGIAAVVTVSVGTASWNSVGTTSAWLKGPEERAYFSGVLALVVTFTRVVFGSLTLGAVIFRFFDHPEARVSSQSPNARISNASTPDGRSATTAAARPESAPRDGSEPSPLMRETSAQITPLHSRLASVPEHHVSFNGGGDPDHTASQTGVLFELTSPTASSQSMLMMSASNASPRKVSVSDSSSLSAAQSPRRFSGSARRASLRRSSFSGGDFATSSFSQDVTRGTIEEDEDCLPWRPASRLSLGLTTGSSPSIMPSIPPPVATFERIRSRSSLSAPAAPAPDRALPTPAQRLGGPRGPSSASSNVANNAALKNRRASGTLVMPPRRVSAAADLHLGPAPSYETMGKVRCRSLGGPSLAPAALPAMRPLSLETKAWLSSLNKLAPITSEDLSRPPSSSVDSSFPLAPPPPSFAPFFQTGWNGFFQQRGMYGEEGGLSPPPCRQALAPVWSSNHSAKVRPMARSGSTHTRDSNLTTSSTNNHRPSNKEGPQGRRPSFAPQRSSQCPVALTSTCMPASPSSSATSSSASMRPVSVPMPVAVARTLETETTLSEATTPIHEYDLGFPASLPLESPVDCDLFRPMTVETPPPVEQVGDGQQPTTTTTTTTTTTMTFNF